MNKRKMTPTMVNYETERVLPQLKSINYTARSVMRKIQEDISNGSVDPDEINAELYTLEHLELVADEILQSLEDAIVKLEKSNDNENS